MATLTAIPVGQGDAFLLIRSDGKTILVDGGRARAAFANQVAAHTAGIDVVVCTHADADHAEGLIGLLQSSLVPVREVWLPGRWCSRLADLFQNQVAFLRELRRDVREAAEGASLEGISEREEPRSDLRNGFDPELIGSILEIEISSDPDVLEASRYSAGWPLWSELCQLLGVWDDANWHLWLEAVQTAARIRDVARAAHHHGAQIRWFDFDEAKNGAGPSGGEAFLKPLNSVELTRGHALRKLGALRFLALSVANRESLVFLAPETDADSPVVFTADSDLACVSVPASNRMMAVTAPHHGSEANKRAYATVAASASNVIWLRSDGNYKKRPGSSFLNLAQSSRVCTLCRNGGAPKQTVRLDDVASGWGLGAGVRGCICT